MRPMEVDTRVQYVDSLYAPEDEGLRAVRDRLITAGRWGVNIGPNEGKILQLLLQISQAKRVVEIGTLFGYSTVWMARALSVGSRLHTIERDHECVRMARKAFEECGVIDRVTLHEGEAEMKLKELEAEGPFDFVFIDANKSAYVSYLNWAIQNVRVGGLIVADNTLMGGKLAQDSKPESLSSRQWEEMREFNRMVAEDARLSGTILPTLEGLTVARRI
jgi:predicted O-methyltransferase YrrM